MTFTDEEKKQGRNLVNTIELGAKVLQYKNGEDVKMLNISAIKTLWKNLLKVNVLLTSNIDVNKELIELIRRKSQINDKGYF